MTTRSVRQPRLFTALAAVFGAALFTACSDQSFAPSPLSGTGGALSVAPAALASSSGAPERTDVLNQGGAGVYAAGGAMVVRQPSGLMLSLSMPTPQPGTYVYAPGRMEVGHPEVFTLWAFVFNYPENCTDPCNGDDLGAGTAAKGGVYNVGGHPASGNSLTLAGRISVGQTPFLPATAPLESPATAEIHLAVAPHGALNPALLPDDFGLPTGSPTCNCWWLAIFH